MQGKFGLSKMRSNYTKVPNKIFTLNLPAISLAIYFLLIFCPEEFNPSIGYMCRKLHITKNTVNKYIQVLIDCEVITKILQGNFKYRSEYKLNPPKNWHMRIKL